MKAARQTFFTGVTKVPGWSLAWKCNCWGTFLDGNHALRLVDKLLSSAAGTPGGEKGGVYPNLFDAHTSFPDRWQFRRGGWYCRDVAPSQDSTSRPAARVACGPSGWEGPWNLRQGRILLDMEWILRPCAGSC